MLAHGLLFVLLECLPRKGFRPKGIRAFLTGGGCDRPDEWTPREKKKMYSALLELRQTNVRNCNIALDMKHIDFIRVY